MSENKTDSPAGKRSQFSILFLLLATTWIGLGLRTWQLRTRKAELANELSIVEELAKTTALHEVLPLPDLTNYVSPIDKMHETIREATHQVVLAGGGASDRRRREWTIDVPTNRTVSVLVQSNSLPKTAEGQRHQWTLPSGKNKFVLDFQSSDGTGRITTNGEITELPAELTKGWSRFSNSHLDLTLVIFFDSSQPHPICRIGTNSKTQFVVYLVSEVTE